MFYGDIIYVHPTGILFPSVDEAIDKLWNTNNHTAFGSLALLKFLGQLILQDAAVITRQYNCDHYIYKQFDKVFKSDTCIKYVDQIVGHLKLSEKTDKKD